jgi:hypothetical protein
MNELKIEIYGISGKIGSGKNYVMEKILHPFLVAKDLTKKKYLFLAFADILKTIYICKMSSLTSEIFQSYEDVFHNKTEESRRGLQILGDEIRKKYGEMFFVNAMKTEIKKHYERSGIERFYITDVRYLEEMKMIKSMGGKVLQVLSAVRTKKKLEEECKKDVEKMERIENHLSETSLDSETFSFTVLNDPGENPVQQIYEWVAKL